MHYLKSINRIFSLVLFLFINLVALAQNTGSFNTDITFMGTRKLALYVPTDSSAPSRYKLMICLHDSGEDCTKYRDKLVLSGWNESLPNTILICPESASSSKDFYYPAGGEEIIEECIRYAEDNYSIDSSYIILQGLLSGGRAACKYGLDHPTEFKGLILNQPLFLGVKDALNYYRNDTFKYANAAKIPVCITRYSLDINFDPGPVDSAYYQMVLNNGIVSLKGTMSLIPFPIDMTEISKFIDNPSPGDYNLQVMATYQRDVNCSNFTFINFLLRNIGSKPINSIPYTYSLNGHPAFSGSWSGTLKPFQHAVIRTHALKGTDGRNNVLITYNDSAGGYAKGEAGFWNGKLSVPFLEEFEDYTLLRNQWTIRSGGDYFANWHPIGNMHRGNGEVMFATNNTFKNVDNSGRRESLITPAIDLSTTVNPKLSFDVAYNYYRFTRPAVNSDTTFADTLEVLISADCGLTYKSIYKKGGKELATYKFPILNAKASDQFDFFPADSNWRSENIDLSAYAGNADVALKFDYISAMGGIIAIDNIGVAEPDGLRETEKAIFKCYPVPAADAVNITSGNAAVQHLMVTDISGREIMNIDNKEANDPLYVNTSSLPEGIYFFKMISSAGVETSKVVIDR